MNYLGQTVYLLSIGALTSALVACGGGGGGSSSPVLTGVFSDSPVGGISYKTETRSGVTTADGKFEYLSGEHVTFFVGSVELPSSNAAPVVTPLNLAGTSDPTNQKVANMLVLLQSLDDDGNPSNGITIPSSASGAASTPIIFDVATGNFSTSNAVTDFIKNAGGSNKSLFSIDAAVSNFVTYQAGGPTGTQDIKIGFAGPLSGAFSNLGTEIQNGAQMAIDDMNAANFIVNGKKAVFSLVSVDDQASASIAPTAAASLVSQGVSGVIGHLNSGAAIAAAPTYVGANIPEISASATAAPFTSSGYATAFRVVANDNTGARLLASHLKQNIVNSPKVLVVHDGTIYGQGVATSFAQAMVALGATVETPIAANNTSTDYDSAVTLATSNSDNVVFYGGPASTAGPLLAKLRAANSTAVFVGGDGVCVQTTLISSAGSSNVNEKVYCAESAGVDLGFQTKFNNFKTRYATKYSTSVQLYAPFAYDAARIIGQAIVQAGTIDKSKILDMLHNVAFVGITGVTDFDASGDIVNGAITIYNFSGGAKTQVTVLRGN